LWIFYALVTAAVFILRRRLPDAERPYRTWGYPVVPLLFILAAAVLLAKTIWDVRADAVNGLSLILHGHIGSGLIAIAQNPPVFGVVLIALGFPAYWLWSRLGAVDRE
jgi:APA family basic amino acid/polyamine antiporter